MTITCWSDYACPYCYIGEKRLQAALEELGLRDRVTLDWKSFELDPAAGPTCTGPTVDRFARKYGLSQEEAAARIQQISQLGQAEGIDFRYVDTRYTNTLDAHRLTKLAQSKGDPALTRRVADGLFDAYFTQNRELAEGRVLEEVGVQAGLDRAEITAMLEGETYTDQVRQDEKLAREAGIQAVPFFVVDGRYALSGAQPKELFVKLLTQAMGQTQDPVPGMHCGIHGCG